MKKQEPWTKQCPYEYFQFIHPPEEEDRMYWGSAPCGNWMPEEYDICDLCILRKYGLGVVGRYDSCGHSCQGEEYYLKEDVIAALRKAEKGDSNGQRT